MSEAADDFLLRVQGVTKRFGGFVALNNVSVDIRRGERFGLIGPNGSGKTTLINVISGVFRADVGAILLQNDDITKISAHQRTRRGVARSFQIPRPFRSMTVLENLMVGHDFAARGDDTGNERVRSILQRMGLGNLADTPAGNLSQVELRKMELARAMAANPQLLVSDEAMAGLSSSEVDEVLDLLLGLSADGITIIMIEHIMHAVMRFSERVMCLDAGKVIALGAPKSVMADARVQEAYLGV